MSDYLGKVYDINPREHSINYRVMNGYCISRRDTLWLLDEYLSKLPVPKDKIEEEAYRLLVEAREELYRLCDLEHNGRR